MGRRRSSSSAAGQRRGLAPLFSSAAKEFVRVDGSSTSAATSSLNPNNIHTNQQTNQQTNQASSSTTAGAQTSDKFPPGQMPSIRFIAHQDQRASRPSLDFAPISRILPRPADVIRVGRYSEKDSLSNMTSNVPSAAPVGFKSKVVSRRHCEFWFSQGQWYVKDVKSSSGTFLNHIRLSQPSAESRPWPVNDGDIIQLGIDFKGGEEVIFRCVKIRVECNRDWQKSLNQFKYVLSSPLLLKDLLLCRNAIFLSISADIKSIQY